MSLARLIRLAIPLPALLAALMYLSLAVPLNAQDDSNDTPLGDVARNLRKKAPVSQQVAPQQVVDDDNLSTVMQQAESRHPQGSALRYLMGGGEKGFQVSAPDVTCSLAFTANVKSLLSSQYAQMNLPAGEVAKLEGPAAIEGDALTVSVFNGTSWHVSEVTVAFTLVRKSPEAATAYGSANFVPTNDLAQESEVRPEKKPDSTVLYHMRAAALPWSTTVFSAPLDEVIAPGDEWHWAIIQAKGYPPQSDAGKTSQASAEMNPVGPVDPPIAPNENSSTVLSQVPQ